MNRLVVLMTAVGVSLTAVSTLAIAATPADDCCSPEAIQKLANAASFLDIVGVKLGMTPKEASAALKAYNPNLQIDVINSRLVQPSSPGAFTKVPHYVVAHTVPWGTQKEKESISLVFALPPSRPVLVTATRYTMFAVGQPVLASTLVDALHKKYGPEYAHQGQRIWVYDANGKPLTGGSPTGENCAGLFRADFEWDMSGFPDPTRDSGEVNLTTTQSGASQPECAPFSFVRATELPSLIAPATPVVQMSVTIGNGALIYGTNKATHDSLQAGADAKAKQQQNDTSQRQAPKL
jgi:hypothetical protein